MAKRLPEDGKNGQTLSGAYPRWLKDGQKMKKCRKRFARWQNVPSNSKWSEKFQKIIKGNH